MLAAAFRRSHALALTLTLVGLAATIVSLFVAAGRTPRQVTPLLSFDTYALFYIGLLTAATAAVAVLSWSYLQRRRVHPEEYYVLLLTATLGGAVLVASTHFASFFLGLEILSVSLYVAHRLPAPPRAQYVEAAVKYLVLAGSTSAFLVFGMALMYAETGTHDGRRPGSPLLAAGLGGARRGRRARRRAASSSASASSSPSCPSTCGRRTCTRAPRRRSTAFIATVSKGAVFALLLRYFRPVSLTPGLDAVPGVRRHRRRLDGGRQPAGPAPGQRQAHPRLLVDRPPGLPAGGVPRHGGAGRHGRDLLPGRLLRHHAGGLRRRRGALARRSATPTCSTTIAASPGVAAGRRRPSRWPCSRWPACR